MANKYYNKIIYGGKTLIDLTKDDVTPSDILVGKKAHDKTGAPIIGSCAYDLDTSKATATAAEVLLGKTAGIKGKIVTGTMPNNGAVNGSISDKSVPYIVPRGYHDGSGTVGIAAEEAAKLIAKNIRDGITILGVVGTMSGTEGAKPQSKNVIPTVKGFTVSPDTDSGYNFLSEVIVAPIPYAEVDNPEGGITVNIATV